MGNTLISIGIGIVILGVLARFGLLAWFGRLPGDIRIENERSSVFIPITSMIIVSLTASVVINVIGRWTGE